MGLGGDELILNVTVVDIGRPRYPVKEHFGTFAGKGANFARVDAGHTKFLRPLKGDEVVGAITPSRRAAP
ncbi:MAG: hypothetical protein LBD02_03030 [Christensenellaceae bacterium]|nr:hypothetical protein [Christensenellaceae bacterium]